MVDVVAAVNLAHSGVETTTKNMPTSVDNVISEINANSDIVTSVSDNYNFLLQISSGHMGVLNVNESLKTQEALEDFSYETELVSKVVSVSVQGINTLVKMQ